MSRESKRRGTMDNLLDQGKNIFIRRKLVTCWKRTMAYIEKLANGKMSTWWHGRNPNRYILLRAGNSMTIMCFIYIVLVWSYTYTPQSTHLSLFIRQLCYLSKNELTISFALSCSSANWTVKMREILMLSHLSALLIEHTKSIDNKCCAILQLCYWSRQNPLPINFTFSNSLLFAQ